ANGLVLGRPRGVLYQGDNDVAIGNAPAQPEIVSATGPPGAAGPTLGRFESFSPRTYNGQIRFPSPGCWRVRLAVRDVTTELVFYVYPADCRPQSTADPSLPTTAP